MRVSVKLALAAAAAAAYGGWGRPWVLNWGATPQEIARAMPGDDILTDVSVQTTRAISVAAPPEAIWPWLVQMGPRPRAGAYTYDRIERLLGIDIENKNTILPEFQHLESGEFLGLNEKGQGLAVRTVDPERALVLQWEPQKSTWAFGLYPEDYARTRLVSRNRIAYSGPWAWLFMVAFMEAGSLVMERKMLLGIKERAERLHRESGGAPQTKPGAATRAGAAPASGAN